MILTFDYYNYMPENIHIIFINYQASVDHLLLWAGKVNLQCH